MKRKLPGGTKRHTMLTTPSAVPNYCVFLSKRNMIAVCHSFCGESLSEATSHKQPLGQHPESRTWQGFHTNGSPLCSFDLQSKLTMPSGKGSNDQGLATIYRSSKESGHSFYAMRSGFCPPVSFLQPARLESLLSHRHRCRLWSYVWWWMSLYLQQDRKESV